MPSRPYSITQAAIVFAVATGSALVEVGASVEPNAETSSLIPAAAYCDLMAARSEADMSCHSNAWSAGPEISRKESILVDADGHVNTRKR